MRRLLITGFGPFPRVPRNPSANLARDVAADPRWRRLGIAVEALVLETRYAAIETHLIPKIRDFRPDAILMLGVAARRRHVSVEMRATNRVSRLMPDAGGRIAPQLAFQPGAPAALRSHAPLVPMLWAMRRRGVDARLSRDAGRYLCNAAYFAALMETLPAKAHGGENGATTAIPVVFIHIPLPQRPDRPARLPEGKYPRSNHKPIDATHRPKVIAQKLHAATAEACIALCLAKRSHSERTGKHMCGKT
ncbi:MAG TPA: peptidase C15 [Saliniramus sp.]|nr:peptidase C15 [Saliniramus sp.]